MNSKTFNPIFNLTFSISLSILVASVFGFSNSLAQTFNHDFGARSIGVGNANITLEDEWAAFNNVAGISGVENGTVAFGYDHYFEIEGFDRVGVAAVQPFKHGTIGISAFKFGDDLLSEQMVSGAFANNIGFVRLGIRANYYQMRIDEFGASSAFFFDFGGIVDLVPKLLFGAYISNLSVSKLNNAEQTVLPVIMKIGLSYRPTDDVMLNAEIYKDVEFDPVLKIGLEYRIIKKIYLRTGINAEPFKAFFGGGIDLGRFKIDYAVSSHQFLGLSHQASIAFKYQK